MSRDAVLIVDDEPQYLEWLEEFLINQAYDVTFVESASEAALLAADKPFRILIFDLNIPISGEMRALATSKGELYIKYPGLYLAMTARRARYRERQVIVYSVHRLEEIERECRKIGCTYIAKGRPNLFKQELLDVLSYDPTKEKENKVKHPSPTSTRRPASKTKPKSTTTKKTKAGNKR